MVDVTWLFSNDCMNDKDFDLFSELSVKFESDTDSAFDQRSC